MFREVRSRVSFPDQESKTLEFWQENQIFQKSVENRRGRPEFVFYEGPPTANGMPGIHHVLARVFKDLFPRYKTMKGFYSERKGGWDTHGLPVELEVEKQLGLSTKKEIEEFGVAEFNARCRDSVFRYVKEWETLTDRIGFWVDTQDPYVTFHNGYIESGWWILKQYWDKGLIYRDYKVTPHCPRCGTSLSSHEVALGYDEASDPSIYVRFRLKPNQQSTSAPLTDRLAGEAPISLLVWTTTPWTLPANVATAINREAEYALVRHGGNEILVLAMARVEAVVPGGEVIGTLTGADLLGLEYEPLFPPKTPPTQPAWRVVAGDMATTALADDEDAGKPFVSLDDGTGIVHMAPAYGAIDLEVGRAENLPLIHTVDLKGEVFGVDPEFDGKFVKDADPLITERLRDRGILYRSDRITHRYPFCWRCSTPLLYYAKASWYIKTTAKKQELLDNNEQINWHPEHIKHGRFGNWLANNIDWAFSRERYWGTPIPIWYCEACDKYECLGSVAELEQRSGRNDLAANLDLHRPYVDEVTINCSECGGDARRIPEVCDAWFDSGAMPVAQWHYPFENEETFEKRFPADFICEAIDQTRGWFYTLHAESTLLFDGPSFKNVICLGLILDGKGEKMSKSRGNVVDPWSVLNVQGADALRWYLYTATPPGNPRRFSSELVDEGLRKFLLTLWNTYSFFVTYARLDGFSPADAVDTPLSELDRWVLSELNRTIQKVTEALDGYDPTEAGRTIETFVDNLSNWYVRRSRRRFWKSENDQDKQGAYATLYKCLVTVAKLLAPFTPFLAEELYQNLVREQDASAPISVHLCDFPVADAAAIDETLLEEVALTMHVVGLGRAVRSKANLRVRQPLARLYVRPKSLEEEATLHRLSDQIKEELNVKEVIAVHDAGDLFDYTVKPRFDVLGPRLGREVGRIGNALKTINVAEAVAAWRGGAVVEIEGHTLAEGDVIITAVERPGVVSAEQDGYVVGVSTELTDDLIAEGHARELVHRIQNMRRTAGFEIADRINLTYAGSPELGAVLERHAEYVKSEVLALSLREAGPAEGSFHESIELGDEKLTIAVVKAS